MTATTTQPPNTTAPAHGGDATNVNVAAAPARSASIWTASRVVALMFTVVEVLLLARIGFKLLGANPDQPFSAALYRITEPLVAPFRGIFAQPDGTPVVEIATLLSILFFVLVAALVVALVRAYTGRRAEPTP